MLSNFRADLDFDAGPSIASGPILQGKVQVEVSTLFEVLSPILAFGLVCLAWCYLLFFSFGAVIFSRRLAEFCGHPRQETQPNQKLQEASRAS